MCSTAVGERKGEPEEEEATEEEEEVERRSSASWSVIYYWCRVGKVPVPEECLYIVE